MTDAVLFVHQVGARALVAFAVVLGVWGTYLYFRRAALTGGFRSSFLIMAGLTAVQGLAGLIVFIVARPHDFNLLHIVYGVFAVLFLPGAFFYAQNGTKRREAVILAGAAWIVAIAYLRGFATG
jgi:heme A synthase